MIKDTTPPLSDEFLREIGLVTAYWSALEAQMEIAILLHQKIDLSVGLVVTSSLGGLAKLNLLDTFNNEGAFEPLSTKEDVKKLLKRINSASARRNEVAHHVWVATDDPKVAIRKSVRAKGKLNVVNERVHIGQLQTIAEQIRQTGEDFTAFMELQGLRP
jgi:hypothetical protein